LITPIVNTTKTTYTPQKKFEKKKRKILLDDKSYNAKLLGLALEKKTKEVVDPLSL
jgi:hypothetical protein